MKDLFSGKKATTRQKDYKTVVTLKRIIKKTKNSPYNKVQAKVLLNFANH